jgi:hypothetical protein
VVGGREGKGLVRCRVRPNRPDRDSLRVMTRARRGLRTTVRFRLGGTGALEVRPKKGCIWSPLGLKMKHPTAEMAGGTTTMPTMMRYEYRYSSYWLLRTLLSARRSDFLVPPTQAVTHVARIVPRTDVHLHLFIGGLGLTHTKGDDALPIARTHHFLLVPIFSGRPRDVDDPPADS